jgi:hypothetical protein
MRRYPLPRAAVALAMSTGSPDPILAAGEATAEEIVDLYRRTRDEVSDATGGQVAEAWLSKMANRLGIEFCPDGDCDEVGLYGIVDQSDHNVVYGVLRSGDFLNFERWSESGWEDHVLPDEIDLRILSEDDALYVTDALREGCDGAYLHPGDPIGFLSRDEEVIIAGVTIWDPGKHPRDAGGKFAENEEETEQSKAHARGADFAKYIKEGGARPTGVKALPKKGASKGGGGGGGKSKGKSKSKGTGKAKKPKSGATAKRQAISRREAKERLKKAKADLKAEQEKQARAATAAKDRAALAAEYTKRIKSGEKVEDVEQWAQNEAHKQAEKVAAAEKDFEKREKIRKLEYARRMAALRAAKSKIRSSGAPLLAATVVELDEAAEEAEDEEGWVLYAVVDELDPNAVMALIRLRVGDRGLELQSMNEDGEWKSDPAMLGQLRGVNPPPLVELTDEQIEMLLDQMAEDEPPKKATTAAMSADPGAAKLRAYWVSGKGRLKIKWGAPGDFKRCVKHLRKYIPARVEGYCANLHKLATGMWPGDRGNRGVRGTGASEDVLWDAVLSGGWILAQPMEVDMLNDGIYSEVEDDFMSAIVAGATFPVAPPDEWFQDPALPGPTPLSVDDTGHVFGHIATFDVPHIGMPGKVHAPRSKSGYAFFKTGQLVTASGGKINVGQLTLAGGHAPLSADAAAAVAHYDNTNSAIADLNIGDDRWGIWVAGAVRPEITQDQLRALRASAPSGDWRPINGSLELVAVCQVNVPGFPVARARVASGAIVALVAAGARPLAVQRASMLADAAVLERVTNLESLVLGNTPVDTDDDEDDEDDDDKPVAETTEVVAAPEAVVEEVEVEAAPEPEPPPVPENIAKAREYIRNQRMERLRHRVHGRETTATVAVKDGDGSDDSDPVSHSSIRR